tara:strand:- start:566 stop:817 length:252 start_codon:yes stop_codon:yes gene_type:complete
MEQILEEELTKKLYYRNYYQNNKEKIKAESELYYYENKDKILEYKGTKIECSCGAKVARGGMRRHLNSIKHAERMEKIAAKFV